MSEPLARLAEADAAKQAWERFVSPALQTLRADYMAKLTEEAIKPMEGRALQSVQNLSMAIRITKEVEAQMQALILDGRAARDEIDRANTLSRMSPEQRRYATY